MHTLGGVSTKVVGFPHSLGAGKGLLVPTDCMYIYQQHCRYSLKSLAGAMKGCELVGTEETERDQNGKFLRYLSM